MNHVLGIVGSPRRRGNTEILVDEVLRGAEESGARVEKIILTKLHIEPCSACDACRKMVSCIKKDDMQDLYEKMEKSQMWVLGTPVYWWGPTAQFKLFMDRWYGAQNSRAVGFSEKKGILVIPFEDKDIATARHTVGMFKDSFNYLKIELLDAILAPGVLNPAEVSGFPKLLNNAYEAGKRIMDNF